MNTELMCSIVSIKSYLPILSKLLSGYPDREAAYILYNGFRYGFRINYAGPRVPYESRNLKSVLNNPAIAWEKVMNEVNAINR
jgi:hypothetical protein